ncbi:hypothetical protein [Neobacillus sp. NPDC093127]|uniref:hypothetical protein n=1 Tax=Neobacillus sp. NPDC093127 TaxID=3364296 RepID=UPI0037FF2D03
MSNRTFSVKVDGLDELLQALDPGPVVTDIDRITEAYTRKMANESAIGAPRKTGKLANSFPSSVRKEGGFGAKTKSWILFGKATTAVWSFGSDLPYALKQEYEHRSKKGFVRKAVWNNREAYREKIRERLGQMGRR